MNESDFLDDWNKTHTSSPTYQDVLDWAEQKQIEEMKELKNTSTNTLALPKGWTQERYDMYIRNGYTITEDGRLFKDGKEYK